MKNKTLLSKYSAEFKKNISEIWQSNTGVDYILHVGKTNSGKTYNALQRLKEVGSGVYLAPLRLLAWEVYDKLNMEGYRCNLVTGEEQIESPNARITASTIEMANYQKEHEIVIIDESFMIGDKDRGKSWLNAILNLKAKEIHIILNEEAVELVIKILELTDRGYEIKKYEMLQKFKFAETNFQYAKKMEKGGVFVTFSRLNVLINKMTLEKMGYTVSFLYGNLPPEIKKQQISDFIEGKTDFLVTTDVIGMGINVPCNYIVFLGIEKFDGTATRQLNPMEIKQIAGRTGRYGLSNANSFVSCTNLKSLKNIKTKYAEETKVDKAYFGLTYEIFSSFPENTTIRNRIIYFKEIPFIPDRLKDIVKKEDVSKYMEIEYIVDNRLLDLKTKWVFLTAPVKQNNRNYFAQLINKYAKDGILIEPYINNNYSDSRLLEDMISEVELYLNLTRNLNHNSEVTVKVRSDKDGLVDRLTTILLDKKLSHKKKCKLCEEMIELTYPYPYCEECYESKIASNYHY